MLPDTRQVGEPQIDHLDLLVLDRLEDIFDCDTIRNHGFTPATESDALKVTLPSGALQSRPGGSGRTTSHLRDAVAPASIRHGDARVQANPVTCEPAVSALVRPAHKLYGVFDMPPVFGQFDLALLFEANGVLSGLHNCPGTVCFQQLPRIVVDFDFSHGVTLLLVQCATVITNRAPEPQMLTPIKRSQSASWHGAFAS